MSGLVRKLCHIRRKAGWNISAKKMQKLSQNQALGSDIPFESGRVSNSGRGDLSQCPSLEQEDLSVFHFCHCHLSVQALGG